MTCLIPLLVAAAQGQQQGHFVVLPASAAQEITGGETWARTGADINGLEASLSQVAGLKAQGGPPVIHIEHPQRYFRWYVGIIRDGKRFVYVNAFCDPQQNHLGGVTS